MSVFKRDTIIGTTRGPVKVEDLKIGDSLIGNNYSFNKICEITKSHKNSKLIKIKGMCTPNMFVDENVFFYAKERIQRRYENKRYYRDFIEAEWINAKQLSKNHFLCVPISNIECIPEWDGVILNYGGRNTFNSNLIKDKMSNPNFWYLIGRYLGDGWTRKCYKQDKITPGGITICHTDKDKNTLIDAVEKCSYKYNITHERTVDRLTIYSKELYFFVERYSHGAYNKTIDFDTMSLPIELLESFVSGYLDSDGSFTENNYKLTTISPYLAYSISQCILKTYLTNYRIYYAEMPDKKILEGRIINQKNQYQVVWNHHIDERNKKAFVKDNKLWFPIKSIEEIEVEDDYYNVIFDTTDFTFNHFYVLTK